MPASTQAPSSFTPPAATPPAPVAAPEPSPPAAVPAEAPAEAPAPDGALVVEVVWGDIARVPGDVHAVGHYDQVLPQSAELALDRVVSAPGASDQELVLTSLARRGILRGELGEVSLYPWSAAAAGERSRMVAVVGMGRPGSFGPAELRRVVRNLAWTLASLPDVWEVSTVLIGGGGALPLVEAVQGLVGGMADAAEPAAWRAPLRRLRIVERELGRARAIHRHLARLVTHPGTRLHVPLTLVPEVSTGDGGVVGTDTCLALTMAAVASAAHGDDVRRQLVDRIVEEVRHPDDFGARVRERLAAFGPDATADVAAFAARLGVRLDDDDRDDADDRPPTRLSFVRDGSTVCASALTDTTVIPERRLDVDDALLASVAATMTDPRHERVAELSEFLTRLVVPRDFRPLLQRASRLVLEVDRDLARLPWELLADRVDGAEEGQPVGLRCEVARQLRTTHSPPPGVERVSPGRLRALVVGDPGDPARGHHLPGARDEALEVHRLLQQKGLEVVLMIGAPGTAEVPRAARLKDFRPASRLDVLMELATGRYDLLHYAGHGDFDPQHPDLTGWLFHDGLFTSRLLERVDVAPSLVVANACLSARTAGPAGRGEADLLPGLADEFFRRGVRNYVGTAWKVNDQGAVRFARAFYDALLPTPAADGSRARGATVGRALRDARTLLAEERAYGALWAAYQHYGDPQHLLAPALAAGAAASDLADG